MIGNDIVDLKASGTESNWRRKGWLEKVFTATEQALVHNAVVPEVMVWLLWSMKEAAYKLHYRRTGSASFDPAGIACVSVSLNEEATRGIVQVNDARYYTKSLITGCFIHTSADLYNNLHMATVYISNQCVSRPYPKDYIFFKDSKGIPYLVNSFSGKVREVSYSHHGCLEALVFFE